MSSKFSEQKILQTNTKNVDLNYDYTYDPNRPHQAIAIGDNRYTYDLNGNVTEVSRIMANETDPESQPTPDQSPPDNPHQSIEDGYTSAGAWAQNRSTTNPNNPANPTNPGPSQDKKRYTWDEENRLIKAEVGNDVVHFAYDAGGQRTTKKSAQKENLYFDKMWQVEVGRSENIEFKNIYLGSERLLTKMGNASKHNATDNSYQKINQYFNHANHIGSVNVITDHQGREFKYVEYTPYGEEWFSESNPLLGSGAVGADGLAYGYTDHQHDEETGLIYANARYLDPKTSRWLSTDPAMEEYFPLSPENKNAEEYNKNLPGLGGVFNSRNLQTYHYAGNNPLKYTDPTGKWVWLVWLGVGAAVSWQSYREIKAKEAIGESGWSAFKDWRALARIGIAGGLTYLGGAWAGSVLVGATATGEILTVGAFVGGELHLLKEFLFMLTRNGQFDESDFTIGFAQAMFFGALGSVINNDVLAVMLEELPYIASLLKGAQGSGKTDWGRFEREFRENYEMIRDRARAEGVEMPDTYEEFEEEMRVAAEEAKERRRVELENRAKGIHTLSPAP